MDTHADLSESPEHDLAQLQRHMAELKRTETTLRRLNEVAHTLSESLDLAPLLPNVIHPTFYETVTFARSCHTVPHVH